MNKFEAIIVESRDCTLVECPDVDEMMRIVRQSTHSEAVDVSQGILETVKIIDPVCRENFEYCQANNDIDDEEFLQGDKAIDLLIKENGVTGESVLIDLMSRLEKNIFKTEDDRAFLTLELCQELCTSYKPDNTIDVLELLSEAHDRFSPHVSFGYNTVIAGTIQKLLDMGYKPLVVKTDSMDGSDFTTGMLFNESDDSHFKYVTFVVNYSVLNKYFQYWKNYDQIKKINLLTDRL